MNQVFEKTKQTLLTQEYESRIRTIFSLLSISTTKEYCDKKNKEIESKRLHFNCEEKNSKSEKLS